MDATHRTRTWSQPRLVTTLLGLGAASALAGCAGGSLVERRAIPSPEAPSIAAVPAALRGLNADALSGYGAELHPTPLLFWR